MEDREVAEYVLASFLLLVVFVGVAVTIRFLLGYS